MANRYLRGTGARNWNDTANWSDVSGGAGGASVPTSADNVIFDANSGTGTITVNAIANMLDFTCSNIGALTLANAAYAFNVFGSLTLHNSLTVTFTSTGYLYMKATDSRNITTNGKVANWNRLYFDGVGGTWVNQDDMNVGQSIYLSAGHWNTNDKTITSGSFLRTDTVTGARTLTLGNSTLNISFFCQNGVTFTLNGGTSTINTTSYCALPSTSYVLYNVNVRIYQVSDGSGGYPANFTCNNLTLSAPNSYTNASFNGNVIVNNNLVINGFNATNSRMLVHSLTIGTPRTITCNGTVTASNVDFRDITLAGTCNKDLSAITGGSGDCGGNTGITFTTAQPQYFKKYAATANYGDAANWFSDLALTVAGRVPLPQDLGSKFLATSFNQTCTVSCNVPRIPSLDMSEVVNSVTWSLANAVEVYGSYVLGNNITQSGNNPVFLSGRGNFNLNLYGKSVYSIQLMCFSGQYINMSNFGCTYGFVGISGTFDFNDFNFTTRFIQIGGIIYLGNGTITINTIYAEPGLYTTSSPTLYSESSTIILIPASGSNTIQFATNNKTFNKIQFSGSHTGNFDISGSNTIAELIIDSGRKVRFLAGTTQTIAKLTAIGTPAAPITLESITAGSRFNLTYTGVNASTVEYCSIKDSKVNQARRLLAKNSTNAGNNQNWGFDTLPPFALNTKQVDKIYYGSNQVSAMYIGNTKIY